MRLRSLDSAGGPSRSKYVHNASKLLSIARGSTKGWMSDALNVYKMVWSRTTLQTCFGEEEGRLIGKEWNGKNAMMRVLKIEERLYVIYIIALKRAQVI